MDLKEFAELLDPKNDSMIDGLDEVKLQDLLDTIISLLEVQKVDYLKHVIRNSRRRLLYSLIPAKVIRLSDTGKQLMIEDEIIEKLSTILKISPQVTKNLTLTKLVRELAMNLIEERNEGGWEYPIQKAVIKKFHSRCQLCGYNFRYNDANSGIKEMFSSEMYHQDQYDKLKPLSFNENLRHYEIDHIIPISSFGTNDIENLYLLCRQCNEGKADYLTYSETRESSGFRQKEFIGKTDIDPNREKVLFYAVVFRDKKCHICNKSPNETELTISPINPSNFFLYDNLRAVCYTCDTHKARWIKRR